MKFSFLITLIIFIFAVSSCASKNGEVKINSKKADSAVEIKTPENKLSQKNIEFELRDKQKVKAQITESSNVSNKTAIFSPSIKMTDSNLYQVASALLAEVYGTERGSIQSNGKTTKNFNDADYLCWEIASPTQDFCVLPFPDAAASGKMTAVSFIVK